MARLSWATARWWAAGAAAGRVYSCPAKSASLFCSSPAAAAEPLDAGLDREHVLSIHLQLSRGGKQGPEFNQRILDAYRKPLPFVRDASLAMCRIPGCIWNTAIHVSGRPDLSESQMHGEENHVGAGFFHTLGIPLLRGRTFVEADQKQTQPVAILDRAFAAKLFGSDDPIGHDIGYKPAPDDQNT